MDSSSSSSPIATTLMASVSVAMLSSYATAASCRSPPPGWTHNETLILIHAYSRSYLSLRCTSLPAPHYEEISITVVVSCTPSASPKTPIECRHKVEKLHKRLSAERRRSLFLRPATPIPPPGPTFRSLTPSTYYPLLIRLPSMMAVVSEWRRMEEGLED